MPKTFIALVGVVLTMGSPYAGEQDVVQDAKKSVPVHEREALGRKCPADKIRVGGHNVLEILELLGAKREVGATDKLLSAYNKQFRHLDADHDGKHSKKEYVENGIHLNPQARRGIFRAADNNADGFVTRTEYVLNRIITDEAKRIVQGTDKDRNGKVAKVEFVAYSPLTDRQLASSVFDALDIGGDGVITVPEYLRVWGGWARPNYKKQEATILTRLEKLEKRNSSSSAKTSDLTRKGKDNADLKRLWSYGLTSRRTGKALIEAGGEHKLDKSKVSYGYNLVVDRSGRVLRPGGRPLQGGEKLVLTKEYQESRNVREYARVVGIMAPIRDAILYNFESTSKEEWLELTRVLRLNNIKTKAARGITPRSVLSIEQVYDYVAKRPTEGSPVMRFLEEAELELKCLAFVEFDFTNPEGRNHAKEHNIKVGSGIRLPERDLSGNKVQKAE